MIAIYVIIILSLIIVTLKTKQTKTKYVTQFVKVAVPINIATQKIENYKVIGYLYNESNKMFPLYGRRVNINNTRWNYYTKTDNYNYSIHIYLKHKSKDCGSEYGCDELYNNDEVYIDEYGDTFKVKLYDNSIRYNPQII